MELRDFREKAFACALERGCEAAESYYAGGESFSVNVCGGEFDRYEVSIRSGLSLRVKLGGKDGYAYTECLDDPEALVARAMDNARTVEIADEHPMQGRCEYQTAEKPASPFAALSESEKIDLALRLERETLAQDARIKRLTFCLVENSESTVAIHNTLGLSAERTGAASMCGAITYAACEDEVRTGTGLRIGAEAADIPGIAAEAAENAVSQFGATPVASGTYRVLLQNVAACDLLSVFTDVFSAEEAQRGRSLLAGREGERIGAACVTLTDDPYHPTRQRVFDDEGTPAYKKNLIERGELKTLLHNLKTAKKAGCASTGNAVRASAASPVRVGPALLYFEPGDASFDALLAQLGTGLVVTSLEGLNAGADCVSGDFSLKAAGYLVENGMRVHPVAQITVAGNFLALLQSVERVGADLRVFEAGSPSLLVSGLTVAGK